jgi:hypothetical protein
MKYIILAGLLSVSTCEVKSVFELQEKTVQQMRSEIKLMVDWGKELPNYQTNGAVSVYRALKKDLKRTAFAQLMEQSNYQPTLNLKLESGEYKTRESREAILSIGTSHVAQMLQEMSEGKLQFSSCTKNWTDHKVGSKTFLRENRLLNPVSHGADCLRAGIFMLNYLTEKSGLIERPSGAN